MGRGQAGRAGYPAGRRCLSAWWAPPPSKRVGRAIPVRRVRFPSTSATTSDINLMLPRDFWIVLILIITLNIIASSRRGVQPLE